MHVPSYGEVPMTLLIGRMQAEQQEKASRQEKQETSMKALRDMKTAPQFQQDYAEFIDSELQSAIAAKAKVFGSEQAALDYYFNTPKGKMEWAKLSSDMNAFGTEVMAASALAVKLLAGVEKKEIMARPEEIAKAKSIVDGSIAYTSGESWRLPDLIKDSRAFSVVMDRSKYINDRILPGIESFAEKSTTADVVQQPDGTWKVTKTGETKYNSMIEAFAKEMTTGGMYPDVETAKDQLTKMFPPKTTEEESIQGSRYPQRTAGDPPPATKTYTSSGLVTDQSIMGASLKTAFADNPAFKGVTINPDRVLRLPVRVRSEKGEPIDTPPLMIGGKSVSIQGYEWYPIGKDGALEPFVVGLEDKSYTDEATTVRQSSGTKDDPAEVVTTTESGRTRTIPWSRPVSAMGSKIPEEFWPSYSMDANHLQNLLANYRDAVGKTVTWGEFNSYGVDKQLQIAGEYGR
jgi:hypothetical protein